MTIRRSFVVRVWLDEDGAVRGQISDPLTDWRRPFHEPTQLWAIMKSFLVEMPSSTRHDASPETDTPSSESE